MDSMKILLASDLHLNFLSDERRNKFYENLLLQAKNAESIIITGDISDGTKLLEHLRELATYIGKFVDINFVLGNHDYYGKSIKNLRSEVSKIENLTFLTELAEPKKLNETTLLIGHDGWYDGLYGDWFSTKTVEMLGDYQYICDFKPFIFKRDKLNELLKYYASQAAIKVENLLGKEKNKKYIFCTHVPPFPENSLYKGKIANDSWLPCFTSKLLGDALLDAASDAANNNSTIDVFCGHSHHFADYSPVPNILRVRTSHAKYREPEESFNLIEI